MASRAYRVVVTQKADEDFRLALAYYLRSSGRQSAEKFVDRYQQALGYLEGVPGVATKIGDSGYFWIPVRSHILVYGIDDGASVVYVARIHYGSSNWREIVETSGRRS